MADGGVGGREGGPEEESEGLKWEGGQGVGPRGGMRGGVGGGQERGWEWPGSWDGRGGTDWWGD